MHHRNLHAIATSISLLALTFSTAAMAAKDDILSHRCMTVAPEKIDRQRIDDDLVSFPTR